MASSTVPGGKNPRPVLHGRLSPIRADQITLHDTRWRRHLEDSMCEQIERYDGRTSSALRPLTYHLKFLQASPLVVTKMSDWEIQTGEKFACIALDNIATETALGDVDLGEGCYILSSTPFALDAQWQKWVGSIRSDRIAEANLFILSKLRSSTPGVVDGETQDLRAQVNRLFYGILMQGLPDYIDGWIFGGSRPGEELEIRQFSDLHDFFTSKPTKRVEVARSTCVIAKRFADGYLTIERSSNYSRVKAGMRAIVRGIQAKYAEDRLHEYVRALEALAKTQISKTERQFIHRCQTFTGASTHNAETLERAYKIRSAVEHMNPVDDVLSEATSESRESKLFSTLRQIETLALAVYLRIATSPLHANLFETNSGIDSFWTKRDDERMVDWGKGVNLAAIE